MAVRVAINGFGRIGRNELRAIAESGRKDIEVVGINDLGPVETNAHLLRYDSVHGRFAGEVTTGENWMDAGRGKIRVTAERDPAKLPWKELAVDVALHLHEPAGPGGGHMPPGLRVFWQYHVGVDHFYPPQVSSHW